MSSPYPFSRERLPSFGSIEMESPKLRLPEVAAVFWMETVDE
jgi:hypothetical protein